jgi:diguanylate cyclase (GGDEF)-like protein
MDVPLKRKKDCWSELQNLISMIKKLSLSKGIEQLAEIAIHEAKQITGADGAAFVLKEENICHFMDENSICPLFKGKQIPLDKCICGWAMEHGLVVNIPDIYNDSRISIENYENTYVKSVVVIPIFPTESIGAIALYWQHEHEIGEDEVSLLQAFTDVFAIAIEKARLRENLEEQVKERTAQLEYEIAERKKIQEALFQQSLTDSLTGILNRRGFFFQVEQELKVAERFEAQSVLMFADIDGLKFVNDTYGHAEGDKLIINASKILKRIFRSSDVLARLGGDEFAAFTLNGSDLNSITRRIEKAIEKFNSTNPGFFEISISIGLVPLKPGVPINLDVLMKQADLAMYENKQQKKMQIMRKIVNHQCHQNMQKSDN